MSIVCWLFQHIQAAALDRDHFDQLTAELGIGQATLRMNPFAQWTTEPPNADFDGHSPHLTIPGARDARCPERGAHIPQHDRWRQSRPRASVGA
eukprot:5736073-Pyramimonas_sp.AAC.1